MTRVRNTFRDGQYHRFVLLGKRTVKEGECAAVWTTSGQRHLIRGPRRIHLFFSHVRFLDRFVADQNEFILVQFRDGRKESFRGPLALFFDPCSHEKMKVLPAYKLEANEALVVYKEEELPVSSVSGSRVDGIFPESTSGKSALKPVKDEDAVVGVRIAGVGERGKVVRKIVRGPAVFVPGANEWVHNFSWHGSVGTDNNHLTEQKKPNALKFNKLRIMPNQMYLSVQDVRTTDDAMLTINFMIFYELLDVEAMLDSTHDPIGDFINAASADVMSFGASNTYESLLQRASILNDVDAFPILASRMEQSGFKLLRVVYRGYSTSDKLKSVHESSIAERTRLKLTADTRAMEHEQAALDLQSKRARAAAEAEVLESEARHTAAVEALRAQAARAARDQEHEQELRHAKEREAQKLAMTKDLHDEEARMYAALKGMGVDLTKYLCTKSAAMVRPDHHVRVDAPAADGGNPPSLHFQMPQFSHF